MPAHYTPIHDHVSGDRIKIKNTSIIKSIFGKFGSPDAAQITFTIQKLNGNILVGDILYSQIFNSPLGSLGEDITIVLDNPIELEPGDYAFGYISGATAGYFGTPTQEAYNPGNTKLRWRLGDADVVNENNVYTATKITLLEKLRLESISNPVNDLAEFQNEHLTYTELNDNHRKVELHKFGKIVATWNETKAGATWSRDPVVRN